MSEEFSNQINKDLLVNAAYQKFKRLEKTGIIVKENIHSLISNLETQDSNLEFKNVNQIMEEPKTILVDNIKNKYLEYKKMKQYLYNAKLGMLATFFLSSGILTYYGPYKKRLNLSLGKSIFIPLSVVLFTNYIIQSSIKSKYKENLMEIISLKLNKL